MSHLLKAVIVALAAGHGALAVGTAFGYSAGTTGGGNAAPAVPSSPARLVSWLGDSTPRVILLDKTYDFTDLEGNQSGKVCEPWTCSPGAQVAIDHDNWCEREAKTAGTGVATWKKAGTTAIPVGSNKTLLGKGTAGWISKMLAANSSSLEMRPHKQLRSLTTFPTEVALGLPAVMAITTEPLTLLAPKIPLLLLITMAVVQKSAGTSPYSQVVHMYNNYFSDITDHAMGAGTGSNVLLEGNYFSQVVRTSVPDRPGLAFAPTSTNMNAQCQAPLGRACVSNTLVGSGAFANAANAGAIGKFTAPRVTAMDPSKVPAYVQANAGLGKIN